MASTAGLSSATGMGTRYAHPRTRLLWVTAAVVGACYGTFLIVTALRLPSGAELTGQFALQPAVKAATAVLLAVAALTHPIARERRWLVAALLFSAAGDFLLAMPWWEPSFVLGLGAFLVAHLCFLAALLPLAARSAPRLAAAAITVVACIALLVWFWPRLIAEGMAVPVTLYIAVLGAMVCTALMARLPTPWTALGAVCFAVSDGMIGISKFVLGQRDARGTDLVGVRDVTATHHRRLVLRPHASAVGAVCYNCIGDQYPAAGRARADRARAPDAVGAAPRPRVRLSGLRGTVRRRAARGAGAGAVPRPAGRRIRPRKAFGYRPCRKARLAGPGGVGRAGPHARHPQARRRGRRALCGHPGGRFAARRAAATCQRREADPHPSRRR